MPKSIKFKLYQQNEFSPEEIANIGGEFELSADFRFAIIVEVEHIDRLEKELLSRLAGNRHMFWREMNLGYGPVTIGIVY